MLMIDYNVTNSLNGSAANTVHNKH